MNILLPLGCAQLAGCKILLTLMESESSSRGGRQKGEAGKGCSASGTAGHCCPGLQKELGPTRVWWHTGLKSETYTFLGLKN